MMLKYDGTMADTDTSALRKAPLTKSGSHKTQRKQSWPGARPQVTRNAYNARSVLSGA